MKHQILAAILILSLSPIAAHADVSFACRAFAKKIAAQILEAEFQYSCDDCDETAVVNGIERTAARFDASRDFIDETFVVDVAITNRNMGRKITIVTHSTDIGICKLTKAE